MTPVYDLVMFDQDGTLFDTYPGVSKGVRYALEKSGYEVQPGDDLLRFIGPPLAYSFVEYYGMSEEESDRAVDYYREYYNVTGLYENVVYPGIRELIIELKAAGAKVMVATAKPMNPTDRILKKNEILQHLDHVSAASESMKDVSKAGLIDECIAASGLTDRSGCIMVGDRKYDIEGAKEAGVRSVGVLYGYGSEEEFREAGADFIVRDAAELRRLLLRD